MTKVAYVFPGQGSQTVGMGKDLLQQRNIFLHADSLLNISLSDICFEGPDDDLRYTPITQPAILTTSIALLEASKDFLPKADYVAGHSLGEYSALVAAGALRFDDAVRFVRERGLLMDNAVPSGEGAMAAVLGGDRRLIEEVCIEASKEANLAVEIANINCPGQIVISGAAEAVQVAMKLLKENGVKRTIPLPVSGPFHSSLMKPVAEKLQEVFEKGSFWNANIPVVVNATATCMQDANELKESLLTQVYSSVLWEDSVRRMIQAGVTTFVEIGPGKVLSGLIKKIDNSVTAISISDIASMEEAKNHFSMMGEKI